MVCKECGECIEDNREEERLRKAAQREEEQKIHIQKWTNIIIISLFFCFEFGIGNIFNNLIFSSRS